MEVKLVVVAGDAQSAEYRLQLPAVIGRSREVELPFGHPLVSRRHCELFEADDVLMVRDLGSLNGTYVGDERITDDMVLEVGDLLTIGSVTFRVLYGDAIDSPMFEEEQGHATVDFSFADDESAAGGVGEDTEESISGAEEFDEELAAEGTETEPATDAPETEPILDESDSVEPPVKKPSKGTKAPREEAPSKSNDAFDMSWLEEEAGPEAPPEPPEPPTLPIESEADDEPAPRAKTPVKPAKAAPTGKPEKSKQSPKRGPRTPQAPMETFSVADEETHDFSPPEVGPGKTPGSDEGLDDFFKSLQ